MQVRHWNVQMWVTKMCKWPAGQWWFAIPALGQVADISSFSFSVTLKVISPGQPCGPGVGKAVTANPATSQLLEKSTILKFS